jgi:hypothetical protein
VEALCAAVDVELRQGKFVGVSHHDILMYNADIASHIFNSDIK